jgi:hypothetical protein
MGTGQRRKQKLILQLPKNLTRDEAWQLALERSRRAVTDMKYEPKTGRTMLVVAG